MKRESFHFAIMLESRTKMIDKPFNIHYGLITQAYLMDTNNRSQVFLLGRVQCDECHIASEIVK